MNTERMRTEKRHLMNCFISIWKQAWAMRLRCDGLVRRLPLRVRLSQEILTAGEEIPIVRGACRCEQVDVESAAVVIGQSVSNNSNALCLCSSCLCKLQSSAN